MRPQPQATRKLTSSRQDSTYPSPLSSRLNAPASSTSAIGSSSRLDKLHAAYLAAPAGKPSTGRSISASRRSSNDVAASLHRPLERSLGSGIGSLGARSHLTQPTQRLGCSRAASVGRRAAEGTQSQSSSPVRQQPPADAYSSQQVQRDSSTLGAVAGSSRCAYADSTSSSGISGRSSLIGRSRSHSHEEEVQPIRAQGQAGAGGSLPLTSEAASDIGSRDPTLAR